MKNESVLILSTSPRTQPARNPRKPATLALRQRLSYGKPRRNNTGKESDPETGLYYFGARYLDPKTSRWISGDPAVSEYIPVAPVNDEARKRNGNLPGMGGVFNYANLHVYHYAGNNPVKYIDPDGRWFGMKEQAKRVSVSVRNAFNQNTHGFLLTDQERFEFGLRADYNAVAIVRNESRRATSESGFDPRQSQEYIEGELYRYSKFAEIRNRSIAHNAEANDVLAQAERIEKTYYDKTNPRKRGQQNYREADRRANEVIDNFIMKYDRDYVPPVNPGGNDE